MLLPFINHKKPCKCFAGDFIYNPWTFRFCVQNHGLPEMRKYYFNGSADNSIMESLVRIISYEICWDMSWKKNIKYFILPKSKQE